VPNFSAFVTLRDGSVHMRRHVPLASSAAPIYVDEEHASDLRALNALLGYLRAHLAPDEGLFGFPAVALVPYALGRRSVTRHDYWYAGRPDHLEEADVVRKLALERPRFIVTVNRNVGFFSNSARYYFILRDFVQQHYTLAARFGRYDVLRRRELSDRPLVVEDYTPLLTDGLVPALAEPLHEMRRAAVRAFLDRAGSAAAIPAAAASVAPDERSLLLLLRAFPEAPDLRTVPFLAGIFEQRSWRLRRQAAQAMSFVTFHAVEHHYLLGKLPGERDVSPADLIGLLDLSTARRWLGEKRPRAQVGSTAAWLLTSVADSDSIPLLERVRVETGDPYLRMLVAHALVKAGRPAYLCDLVDFLGSKRHEYQDAIPTLLIEVAPSHPTELALCLSRGLVDERTRGREVSAWTAGAAHMAALAPALRDALHDPERRVRIAAAWALGRIGDREARPELGRLMRDPDEQTQVFAAEALGHLAALRDESGPP
jgi:hypothetical protein